MRFKRGGGGKVEGGAEAMEFIVYMHTWVFLCVCVAMFR